MLINIIIVFRNEEKYIKNCIQSILNQTYKNFELILVNDASTDKSKQIVKSFKDKRIKYYENNKNLGITQSRNIGLSKANSKYIFFTDADCIVIRNWLKEGLQYLKKGFLGVEGNTIHMLKNPSMSHRMIKKIKGHFGTGNIAYDFNSIKKVGLFNPKLKVNEDMDLGLRIKKLGPIFFNKKMIVYHTTKKWTFQDLLSKSKNRGISRVHLIKKHKFQSDRFHFIVFPKHLIGILFPPFFLIGMCLKYKIKDLYDIKILFAFYLAFIVERYYIWKTAIKERIFLI